MLHTEDHLLEPMEPEKGPDFVVYLESEYDKKDTAVAARYNQLISSDKYQNMKRALAADSGDFEFLPGLPQSPWRVAVLRRPLFDILQNTYTKDEQGNAIQGAIADALNLLVAAFH